jgi:hypothetical protein
MLAYTDTPYRVVSFLNCLLLKDLRQFLLKVTLSFLAYGLAHLNVMYLNL